MKRRVILSVNAQNLICVSARVHGVGEDGDQHAEREAHAVADRRRCREGRRQPEEKVQTGDWTGKTGIDFTFNGMQG